MPLLEAVYFLLSKVLLYFLLWFFSFFPLTHGFTWYYLNPAIVKSRPKRLGDTQHFCRKLLEKSFIWTLNKLAMLEQKQMLNQELWHHKPCLTRCWAPKPKGLLVFSLWRLDKSTHAGHSGNMKGHEVSNPSRHTVEVSVRHSASTTFHRAKHLFMSEQIGRSSNLFSFPWLQCDECREWEREKEREGVWRDSSVQFTWKHCDTLQDWILILATLTILSERQ